MGAKFRVRTDHAALLWLRRMPEPVGQQARWLEIMEEYDFAVEHRAGIAHRSADSMSRLPCYNPRCCVVTATAAEEARDTPRDFHDPSSITAAQRLDADIGVIFAAKEAGKPRPTWDDIMPFSEATKALWRQWDRIELKNGVLIRVFYEAGGATSLPQIIMPFVIRRDFLVSVHGGVASGHFGRKRTEAAVRARAYWPGWTRDVDKIVRECTDCAQYHRGKISRKTALAPIVCREPNEILSIDITGPHPASRQGYVYILTLQDNFTKWVEAYPIRRHTAPVVAKLLFDNYFMRFGCPLKLLSDRGAEFESDLFHELCRLMGVSKIRTTPYRPQTNGMLERFHRTLNAMLAKVIAEDQRDWPDHLPSVTAAYRATRSYRFYAE